MKSRIWIVLFSIIAVVGVSDPSQAIVFSWAFLRQSGEHTEVIDFSKRASIKNGDGLRIRLDVKQVAYVYLFLFDSSRVLQRFYPESLNDYKGVGPGRVSLPSPYGWFAVDDNSGIERFTLIVSANPLEELEIAAVHFERNRDDLDSQAVVLEELRRVIQQHSDLAAPTETGVPIAAAVQTRDIGDEIEGLATLVEADGFYSKTLRILHE